MSKPSKLQRGSQWTLLLALLSGPESCGLAEGSTRAPQTTEGQSATWNSWCCVAVRKYDPHVKELPGCVCRRTTFDTNGHEKHKPSLADGDWENAGLSRAKCLGP